MADGMTTSDRRAGVQGLEVQGMHDEEMRDISETY